MYSQWSTSTGINQGRNDDIYFVSDSVGFVAGGNREIISKTTDGGNSWFDIFTTNEYLRSIEFIDPSTGFAGSLDSGLYVSRDSGTTWQNIASTITPRPRGICGLSIPNDSVVYGCGFFNEPAFIIKSIDRGNTWTYTDMSVYAKALVEIHFINKDTGFVAGKANPATDGGIILRTTDGGLNWTPLLFTNTNLDYVWKIQSPDGKNYFAAVSSPPNSTATSFLKSTDGGLNWTKSIVDTAWYDIQMIGFIDSLHGWTGGANQLFETFDGGNNWNKTATAIPNGSYFNRFIKKNDSTAFISGLKIYKYDKNSIPTGSTPFEKENPIHSLRVFPNPTSLVRMDVSIGNTTSGNVLLVNEQGEVVEELFHGTLFEGNHEFISDKKLSPQVLFVVMRTNEGLYTEKVIVK